LAVKVSWSELAISDVEAIAAFIARDSQFYARAVVSRIVSATDRLSDFPESGRLVPELGQQAVREIFAYQYRIIYRVEDSGLTVLTVIHGKRTLHPEGI